MGQFWNELKRRHVIKAGIAYLVAAWLIIQVLSILFPAFEASPEALRTAIIFLLIGFPIWIVIAWVYDFSIEGIKRTEDVEYDPKISKKKGIGLNRFIIGGLSIAVILLVFNTFRMQAKMETIDSIYQTAISTNFTSSVALLPFENLSPEKKDDFFTKGLAMGIEQSLTNLKGVKVVSSNSTNQYPDGDQDIQIMGEELDVAYFLDGNVTKIGDAYRANIEMINAKNGEIIWAKKFDGNIEDILTTYDSVAKEVASYLEVTFEEGDLLERKVDVEAYLLYLKAKDTLEYVTRASALAADSLIRRSINIDPTYSQSYVVLSNTTLHRGIRWKYDTEEDAISDGKSQALKALELDPTNAAAYTWLSNWNWYEQDIRGSLRYADSAMKYAPNNAATMSYLAILFSRTNQIKESLRFSEKGIKLDPKYDFNYATKMNAELMFSDYTGALKSIKELKKLSKEKTGVALEAYIYSLMGDQEKALTIVESESLRYDYLVTKQMILSRMGRYTEADSLLQELQSYPNDSLSFGLSYKQFTLSYIYAANGRRDLAFDYLNKSSDFAYKNLDWLFTTPEFKILYDDPRWKAYIDRLREDFQFDFPYRVE